MERPQVSFKSASGGALALSAIARLRYEAWRHSGDLGTARYDEDYWRDEHDAHASHVLARADGALVGAVRYCVHRALEEIPDLAFYPRERRIRGESDFPVACMNRLVVAPEFQRLGIGRRLVETAIERLAAQPVATVLVSANPRMAGYLRRLGFIPIGRRVFEAIKPRLPLQFFILRVSPQARSRRL